MRGEPSIYALCVEITEENAVLDLGNGTKCHYNRYIDHWNNGSYYLLQLEELGNDNRRHFSYTYTNGAFLLKRIRNTNHDESLTLNWLNFDNHNHHLTVTASNGQEAHYIKKIEKGTAENSNLFTSYKAKFNKAILHEASSNQYSPTKYEVIKRTRYLNTIFSVSKVKKANGRFLKVKYDDSEKVKKLFSSGIHPPLYTFSYHSDRTTAVDARGAKKRFEFSKRRQN